MNKLLSLLIAVIVITGSSCEKEYSLENGGNTNGNGLIVGVDCRISKIAFIDTSTNKGFAALTATIDNLDNVTRILKYDSLSSTIDYLTTPTYSGDTIYINTDEYFIVDVDNRIIQLHGLIDPTDPFSLQFDVNYFYNALGYLTSKFYSLTSFPGVPYKIVSYTHSGGNLTHMSVTDLMTGNIDVDADITYYTNIIPKRYLYIFPDEKDYPYFNQFYNYGQRPFNAVKSMTVRYYDPGNVLRDSAVSTFSNYIMSRDTYVLSVQMSGDDQPGIPVFAGKLNFSYHCR